MTDTRTRRPSPVAEAPTRVSTGRTRTVALWGAQIVLASQFLGAGLVKITGDPAMVEMFSDIGAGQWFRYLVGALELAGAVGLLLPRLCGLAALGLAGLMVGATITNVVILDAAPWLPIVFLVVSAAIAVARRARTRALLGL